MFHQFGNTEAAVESDKCPVEVMPVFRTESSSVIAQVLVSAWLSVAWLNPLLTGKTGASLRGLRFWGLGHLSLFICQLSSLPPKEVPYTQVIFNLQLYPLPLSFILTRSALTDLMSVFRWPLSSGNREIMCFPHHRISRAIDAGIEY